MMEYEILNETRFDACWENFLESDVFRGSEVNFLKRFYKLPFYANFADLSILEEIGLCMSSTKPRFLEGRSVRV